MFRMPYKLKTETAKVDNKGKYCTWSNLHDAASNGDDEKIQELLTKNENPTAKEVKLGNTPLHEAAWRGYSRCVKILCSFEYNGKSKTVFGAQTSRLFHSTLLSIQNDEGSSALHLAAQNGHNQSCRELLLAGSDPDLQNNYGDTALHTACRYGHAGAARILLSAACDPSKTNLNGDSPLHISCAMGRRKLTKILLKADCNIKIKNFQNETPWDIAIRKNHGEILEILNNSKALCKSSYHDGCTNKMDWSPYGCHYFPDPRSFPLAKIETLPKEPLKKGEQYYLDLGGHIHKGPIGVGNACYCGPFFRHIEGKINFKRSLRQHARNAKKRVVKSNFPAECDNALKNITRSWLLDHLSKRERARQPATPNSIAAKLQRMSLRSNGSEKMLALERSRSLESFNFENSANQSNALSKSLNFLDENSTPADQLKDSPTNRDYFEDGHALPFATRKEQWDHLVEDNQHTSNYANEGKNETAYRWLDKDRRRMNYVDLKRHERSLGLENFLLDTICMAKEGMGARDRKLELIRKGITFPHFTEIYENSNAAQAVTTANVHNGASEVPLLTYASHYDSANQHQNRAVAEQKFEHVTCTNNMTTNAELGGTPLCGSNVFPKDCAAEGAASCNFKGKNLSTPSGSDISLRCEYLGPPKSALQSEMTKIINYSQSSNENINNHEIEQFAEKYVSDFVERNRIRSSAIKSLEKLSHNQQQMLHQVQRLEERGNVATVLSIFESRDRDKHSKGEALSTFGQFTAVPMKLKDSVKGPFH